MLKKMLIPIFILTGFWLWWTTSRPIVPYIQSEPEVEINEIEEEPTPLTTWDSGDVEKFFYNQLDEDQRAIYRALRDGVYRHDESIQLDIPDSQDAHHIFRLVMFDHPEFFWATGSSRSTVYTWDDGRIYTVFRPEYGHDIIARESMQAGIDAAVDAFLAGVEPGLSEHELVRAVYEYLIRTVTYNLDAPDHQNIYSVFVNRESVCAGISKAAQLLLNRLGIFATYVVGDAYVPGSSDEPIPHAWNLIRVNDTYYHLDVTWGSPGFLAGSPMYGRIDVVYDYLFLNDELIFRTHTLDEIVSLPAATSLAHNFFVMNGMFHTERHDTQLLEAMNTSISNHEASVSFKFATPTLYQEMRPVIIDDLARQAARNLAEWNGLDSAQFFIREKENLNLITIFWVYE